MWILRPQKTWTTIFRGPMCRNRYIHSSLRTHFQFTNVLKEEAKDKAPSFRSKVVEEIRQEAFTDKVGSPGAAKQILVRCSSGLLSPSLMVLCDQFVTFGSLLAISYAAQRTDFETEYWTRKLGNHSWSSALTNLDLKRAQRAEFVKVCFFISSLSPFCLNSIHSREFANGSLKSKSAYKTFLCWSEPGHWEDLLRCFSLGWMPQKGKDCAGRYACWMPAYGLRGRSRSGSLLWLYGSCTILCQVFHIHCSRVCSGECRVF